MHVFQLWENMITYTVKWYLSTRFVQFYQIKIQGLFKEKCFNFSRTETLKTRQQTLTRGVTLGNDFSNSELNALFRNSRTFQRLVTIQGLFKTSNQIQGLFNTV